MSEDLLKSFDKDIEAIHAAYVSASSPGERAMKVFAHLLLRVWTRLYLESGQKLSLTPPQFLLASYEGKMNWVLNETYDFKALSQIQLGTKYGKRHGLVVEVYAVKKDDKVRLSFALEEEEVRGRPVFVNYLLHEGSVRNFELEEYATGLRPSLEPWLQTILAKDDKPLWEFCKSQLECVGV
jgi:hypothetical protein